MSREKPGQWVKNKRRNWSSRIEQNVTTEAWEYPFCNRQQKTPLLRRRQKVEWSDVIKLVASLLDGEYTQYVERIRWPPHMQNNARSDDDASGKIYIYTYVYTGCTLTLECKEKLCIYIYTHNRTHKWR